MLEDLLLWLFVVFAGIAVGAGLYELRINVPRWFPRGPSATQINQAAFHEDDAGRRFWAFISTGPLTLMTLASCVVAWDQATARKQWWLGAATIMLCERIGTFGYFIPRMLAMMAPGRVAPERLGQAARQWSRLNYARAALAFAAWLAALRALSL